MKVSQRARELLVPAAVTIVLAVVTWFARAVLVNDDRLEDRRWVAARGDHFVAELKDAIAGAARRLDRETSLWISSSVSDEKTFRNAGRSFLDDFPAFSSFASIKTDGALGYEVDRDPGSTAMEPIESPRFMADRDTASAKGELVLSGPYQSGAGASHFFLIAPTRSEISNVAWFVAGFRMSDLLAFVHDTNPILSAIDVIINAGGKEVARTRPMLDDRGSAAESKFAFDSLGVEFHGRTLTFSPPKTRAERLLPTVVLALGLGVAALVGVALQSAMRTRNLARITQAANASLRQSERRFRVLAEQAPVGIFQIDAKGGTQHVNARFAALCGLPAEKIKGGPWFVALHPEDRERVANAWNAALAAREPFESELRFGTGDQTRWLKVNAVALLDDAGHAIGMIGTAVDITQRMRDEQQLKALALIDELTGLYNRRGFLLLAEQQLKVARRADRPCVLVFADLDGLKQINDDRGHAAGDRALSEAARFLKATFRESDIVGRIGGDEFAVLAVNATLDDADKALARLADQIARRNRVGAAGFELGISTGTIAVDAATTAPLPELLAAADSAMYRGREERRG